MNNPYVQVLEFLVDAGVTVPLQTMPNNRFERIIIEPVQSAENSNHPPKQPEKNTLQPHLETLQLAKHIVETCKTLDDLKSAIQNFDGLALKKNAGNLVFDDGNPDTKIMIIGDAPGSDEDRIGKSFVGGAGQLLDKIIGSIGLSRLENDIKKSAYLTDVLKWRPPGNRTPTDEELAISSIFIDAHIELIQPKILILCGGIAAQAVLKTKETLSKLRGKPHAYSPTITAFVTYHPSALLTTPLYKRKVWEDMLSIQDYLNGLS